MSFSEEWQRQVEEMMVVDPIMVYFGILQAEAYANGHEDTSILIKDLFRRKSFD